MDYYMVQVEIENIREQQRRGLIDDLKAEAMIEMLQGRTTPEAHATYMYTATRLQHAPRRQVKRIQRKWGKM